MAKNKVRLRKKMISPDNIDQYKNYSRLMKRHERYMKLQGLFRFLIYFAIVTILLVLILVALWRIKEEQHKKSQQEKTTTSIVRKPKA
jgi:hypothetical protein